MLKGTGKENERGYRLKANHALAQSEDEDIREKPDCINIINIKNENKNYEIIIGENLSHN